MWCVFKDAASTGMLLQGCADGRAPKQMHPYPLWIRSSSCYVWVLPHRVVIEVVQNRDEEWLHKEGDQGSSVQFPHWPSLTAKCSHTLRCWIHGHKTLIPWKILADFRLLMKSVRYTTFFQAGQTLIAGWQKSSALNSFVLFYDYQLVGLT